MSMFVSWEAWELEKWLGEWAIDGKTMTLCDVRRSVEDTYWKWRFTNEDIVDAMKKAWWRITNRSGSGIPDWCFVDMAELNKILNGNNK